MAGGPSQSAPMPGDVHGGQRSGRPAESIQAQGAPLLAAASPGEGPAGPVPRQLTLQPHAPRAGTSSLATSSTSLPPYGAGQPAGIAPYLGPPPPSSAAQGAPQPLVPYQPAAERAAAAVAAARPPSTSMPSSRLSPSGSKAGMSALLAQVSRLQGDLDRHMQVRGRAVALGEGTRQQCAGMQQRCPRAAWA